MKRILLLASVIMGFIGVNAQQSLNPNRPILSPEIHPDNTVTFRMQMPASVKSVRIGGDMYATGSDDLKKNAQGIWEVTTKVLPSELYSYFMVVDGVPMLDPLNVYRYRDVANIMNMFIIGGGKGDLYKVNKVPHGDVSRVWYNSPSLGMQRRMSIYTPPGYTENNKEKYPVFYLLHGMGGDEEAWLALGRAAQIFDNLIAQGKAKPMIVVMPNGNVSMEGAPGETSEGLIVPNPFLPKTMDGTFENAFPDIVKYIDNNYRTIRDKKHRAIGGLSMGGYHSKYISALYPDMFDYVGLFSAAVDPWENSKSPVYSNMDVKLKKQFSNGLQLYWIAIGKDDGLYPSNTNYRKYLDDHKYPYTYYETGGGHAWVNWRDYLIQFVQKIFK